jgi:hypothetical protein
MPSWGPDLVNKLISISISVIKVVNLPMCWQNGKMLIKGYYYYLLIKTAIFSIFHIDYFPSLLAGLPYTL